MTGTRILRRTSPRPRTASPNIPTPTSAVRTIPPGSSDPERGQGMPVLLRGSSACSFSFEAEDTPARLQAYPPLPNDQQAHFVIHATCTPRKLRQL